MSLTDWLVFVVRNAEQRGLPELGRILEVVGRATVSLRAAEWNQDASGRTREQSTTNDR
jgi:hypothetical protein